MSKFDYRDPGQDPSYCNALSDAPDPIDLMEQAEMDLDCVLAIARVELQRANNPERVHAVWQRLRRMEQRIATMARAAAEKADRVCVA